MYRNLAQLTSMKCDIYTDNSLPGALFAAIFGFGIYLSYVPQQITIVRRRSTEGINPYFLMLMGLGSTFSFSNILVLSKPVVQCCRSSIGWFDCTSSLLGAAQLFAGFIGPISLVALSVKYRDHGNESGDRILSSARIVAFAVISSWILVAFTHSPQNNKLLATVFGIAALCIGLVQYFPQLLTTYRLKHTGSLSVTTMLVQIPGGFIWAFSLMFRKDSHWSTWISVMAAASLQLTLLIMALYYSCLRTAEIGDSIVNPTPSAEQEPLVRR